MISYDAATKQYPDGTVALDNLTLECPTGRITVFVGTSGGGKTTALRMVNRMVTPTSGRVLIDGEDVRERSAAELRRGIGYVIQQVGLFPHRTIVDNIATVPYLLGWGRKKARARAYELMETLGLPTGLARRYPFQLSGGQQQRVGVARALAADPPIMLMDEPFSAVDPVVRAELQDEFLRLQSELHKTIVFVTHDVDEAIRLGDHIAVFRTGGTLVQHDTPENLLARPADDFVASFVGRDRGIRRLSFHPAAGLPLRDDVVAATTMTSSEARALGRPWLLVVDGGQRPLGWVAVDALPADGTLEAAPRHPVGNAFHVSRDSLRTVLDAAVLSPSGLAVGLDDGGAVVGVVGQAELTGVLSAALSPAAASGVVSSPTTQDGQS